jgi:hypothetical protein
MIFAAAVSLAGYVIFAVSPVWWLFIPGSILLTASAYFSFMGSMALLGETVDGDRRAVCMATLRLVSLPVALLAPPLGGVLIATLGMVEGFRVSVIITILLTCTSIWVQRKLYRLPPPAVEKMSLNIRAAWNSMAQQLRCMLVANCFMAFGAGMSGLFIVLYAMNILEASAVQFGLLQSVMVGATSVLSIPVGKVADRKTGTGRKPFAAMANEGG